MTDHLVSPDYTLPLGSKSYPLDSSFQTLKAIQHAFQQDLLPIQARVLDMRQDEIAKLIAIGSGQPEIEIGQAVLDEVGLTEAGYQLLKAHLMAWLYIAMAPKADREKKRKEMGELIGKLSPASRGKSTKS
jgi:hypothetical protein